MYLRPESQADGYKLGHKQMHVEGTEYFYENFTPRSARLFKGSNLYDGKMVVSHVQGFVREFLVEMFSRNFFSVDKERVVSRYTRRVNNMMGKGTISVKEMGELWDLGYLPLCVKSLPEGARVKMGVPVMTIASTHKKFGWLVGYLETLWSNSIWKGMVNTTIAFEYMRVFKHYAKLTGADMEFVKFQGHDFSARGMSGPEDAARSGASHLMAGFVGTDTISAIDYLEDYYYADSDVEMVGVSVPATEHSVSSSNILFIERKHYEAPGLNPIAMHHVAEYEFLKRYVTEVVPTGVTSYVADTYDYWCVLTEILPLLKSEIMGRDGKLVIRPDSGDPVKIITGYTEAEYRRTRDGIAYPLDAWDGAAFIGGSDPIPEHEIKGSIQLLWELFGGTVNEAGYKVLDPHIGLIYGDSITLQRQEEILKRLMEKGFASSNVVLGIGSYTYNYSTRDTFGSAVKATGTMVDGEFIEIYKDPAGVASKKSAKGLLRVDLIDGEYVLKDQCTPEEEAGGELKVVFLNGNLVRSTSLSDIRQRLAKEE